MRKMGYKGLIIGVTGHAQRADIEEFERCGADAVLAKPLSIEESARQAAGRPRRANPPRGERGRASHGYRARRQPAGAATGSQPGA